MGERSFTVEPRGKKFATKLMVGGLHFKTWLSKRRRVAEQKGRDFVAERRMSQYLVTAHHREFPRTRSAI